MANSPPTCSRGFLASQHIRSILLVGLQETKHLCNIVHYGTKNNIVFGVDKFFSLIMSTNHAR